MSTRSFVAFVRHASLVAAIGPLACAASPPDPGGRPGANPIDLPTLGDGTSSGGSSDDESTFDPDGSSTYTHDDPRFDLGAGDDAICDPTDPCCVPLGVAPPHLLLEAFAAQYPAAMIPSSIAALQIFAPSIEELSMAWSDENVGGELIDAANGGVIEANLDAGRTLARDAARLVLPPGADVIAERDDPPVIVALGGPAPCDGVGWAWGSVLYEETGGAVGELVYLYIGFCADPFAENDTDDMEVFYYSEQAVQICDAPG